MTLEQAKVFLEMGDDMVLNLTWSKQWNPDTRQFEPFDIQLIFKSDDYDDETFDQRFLDLTRDYEWTLKKDTGEGLEVLR